MNPTAAATGTTNATSARYTGFPNDRVDYSWPLLGLLAVVLVAWGLRAALWHGPSR